MKVQWFIKVRSKTDYRSRLRLRHTMQTNPSVEQSRIIRWSESPCNQSGRKEKGLRRKGFAEEPSLEFRMKHWASKTRCKRW